ncbi:MAG: DJ-1/PfpI family protein [Gemmatimonadales bacterium]|nr:MAG: DJ-1/PfpI family protein [Gemmatimonadales bacterium]
MNEPRPAAHDPASASRGAGSSPPSPIRRVGIVVWQGVELLDFAGPGQVFAVAGFEVSILAARPGTVVSQGFLRVEPTGTLGEGPAPELLVVPGGGTESALADDVLVAAIGRAAADADLVMSVCTGALLLGAAGVLDELEATTWHGAMDRLRALAPRTRVLDGVRWVDNGRVVTAAGVSAGIDASLHLVARLRGEAARADVARYMEYRETSEHPGHAEARP